MLVVRQTGQSAVLNDGRLKNYTITVIRRRAGAIECVINGELMLP